MSPTVYASGPSAANIFSSSPDCMLAGMSAATIAAVSAVGLFTSDKSVVTLLSFSGSRLVSVSVEPLLSFSGSHLVSSA